MCARSRWFHSPAASPRPLAERAAALSSDQAARKALRGPVTGVVGVRAMADPPRDRSHDVPTDPGFVVPRSVAAARRMYLGHDRIRNGQRFLVWREPAY